jgi:hypothetical protein
MGAVADFVGDVVGGVVEAVGDVVEAVGDVVSDAADWIGDNVVQPILDDPITFIAAAAAYSMGIPGLSFAGPGTAASVGIATTGSRLAQGDEFDDAVKAGAFAAAGTGIGNALEVGIKTGGKDWSPNLYSTADDAIAKNLATGVPSSQIDDQLVKDLAEGPRYTDSVGFEDLASLGDDTLELKDTGTYWKTPSPDDLVGYKVPYGGDDLLTMKPSDVDVPSGGRKDTYWNPGEGGVPGYMQNADQNLTQPPGGYKPALYDADSGITPKKEPIYTSPQPGDPDWVPPIEDRGPDWGREVIKVDADGNVIPPTDKSLTRSLVDLGKAGAERVGDWIWDGAKWVFQNPEYLVGGLLLADTLLSKIDGPGDDDDNDDKTKIDDDEDAFNKDLEQLVLDRDRVKSGFGRGDNPYESDQYSYAESGKGEHDFYTPTVYTPADEYDASKTVNAARGGSIGALNNQLPSYYRYGVMPMATGGYASGGLKSLKHDGRSDHIPAMLSDGEYVLDAETVALLGNGSNEAGANRLEGMRQEIRKQKGKALSKGKFSSNAKSPLAYIKQKRG